MTNLTAEQRPTLGEGLAFFHWHRFHRPDMWACEKWQHRYHLAYWKQGYR